MDSTDGRVGGASSILSKAEKRRVNGVLSFDKSSGLSSNTALQSVKRLYAAFKAGHAGTLDPLASGLLPVCLGEATKFSQALLDADKAYSARLRLGVVTATGDAEGQVLETREVRIGAAEVDAVLARFVGEIEQVPPMYSALKHGGRPLYELARQGMEVERAPRRIVIHSIHRIECVGERLCFDVECSKGTYIRTLAADIGAALGCGAHLESLRRTRCGGFSLAEAVTLDQLRAAAPAQRLDWLKPIDALLGSLPRLQLDKEQGRRLRLGQAVGADIPPGAGPWRLYVDEVFLGVGRRDEMGGLAPGRLVAPDFGAYPAAQKLEAKR